MINWHLVFLLSCFAVLNVSFALVAGIFVNMPDVLNEMFNESYTKHYGAPLSDGFVRKEFVRTLGNNRLSTITSICSTITAAGQLLGMIFFLPLLDKYGRKFCTVDLRIIMTMVCCVMQILSALLPSFECFIISQLLVGIILMSKYPASIIYLSECLPDKNRGLAAVITGIAEPICSIMALTVSQSSIFGTLDKWNRVPVFALFICLTTWITFRSLPESPKFLVAKSKFFEACRAFQYYHGEDANIKEKIESARREFHGETFKGASLKEIWQSETLRKSLFLVMALLLAAEASPLNFEMVFSIRIQNLMGLSIDQALAVNTICRIVVIPLYFFSICSIDRLGRRFLLHSGFALCVLKTVLMIIGTWIEYDNGPSTLTIVIALANDGFTLLAQATAATQVYLLISAEVVPITARSSIPRISGILSYVFTTVFMFIAPMISTTFMPATYIIPLALQLPLSVYIIRNLPETKCRAVADIVDDFDYAVRSRAPTRCSLADIYERSPLLNGASKRDSLL